MAKTVKDTYSEILKLRNEFYQKWQDAPQYDENRDAYRAKYEAFDKALELLTPSIVNPQPEDSGELPHSVTKMSDQEEPINEDRLHKASKEFLKVLLETPYNNTPITNAQTIVRELVNYLENPSKYDPNHVTDINEDLLDEIHNRWEDDPHTKWPKCPYKDFKNIACHFANWQKERDAKYRADNNICCMNFDDIEAARIGAYEQGKSDMKQLMMKSSKLSGWVARDEDGSLHLFEVKPRRIEDRHQWWDRDYNCTALKKSEFPDLKWEDEPVYVKLPIIVED